MKSFTRIGVGSILASFLNIAAIHAADTAVTPAGYWEGSISTPNREIPIRVEFIRNDATGWRGTIDILPMGFRGFVLKPLKVDGAAVEFGMPDIPGDPSFTGKVAADGKTIAGEFTQGGNPMPFQLERKTKPAPEPRDETPAHGAPGKGLAGNWRGSLKPMANVELRLSLELASVADGKLDGALVSLDQGNARLPVAELVEKDGAVRFETPKVQGSFVGKMNADGSEIAGEWTQLGRTTPLVFKRLPSAPPSGAAADRR